MLIRFLHSRWAIGLVMLVAAIVWAVWQPPIPAPTAFWDSKP